MLQLRNSAIVPLDILQAMKTAVTMPIEIRTDERIGEFDERISERCMEQCLAA